MLPTPRPPGLGGVSGAPSLVRQQGPQGTITAPVRISLGPSALLFSSSCKSYEIGPSLTHFAEEETEAQRKGDGRVTSPPLRTSVSHPGVWHVDEHQAKAQGGVRTCSGGPWSWLNPGGHFSFQQPQGKEVWGLPDGGPAGATAQQRMHEEQPKEQNPGVSPEGPSAPRPSVHMAQSFRRSPSHAGGGGGVMSRWQGWVRSQLCQGHRGWGRSGGSKGPEPSRNDTICDQGWGGGEGQGFPGARGALTW